MYQTIQIEKKDAICILSINSPKTLNALSTEIVAELHDAIDSIEADSTIRVVILTGCGRAFVAGADIKHMCSLSPSEAQTYTFTMDCLYSKIEESKKIYIAAINGFALGGGCELALACDIRIASERAKIGLPEVSLGIIPGGGGTQRLSRICGEGCAKRLILTAEFISAADAKGYGIVTDITAEDELMAKSFEIAEKILKNGPVSVSYAKSAIHHGAQMDQTNGINYELRLFGLCFAESEQKEGMAAFIEKRPAKF